MNMSMAVTERDKKLLLIVGTVGFVVLFITFGLMPGIADLNTAKADLATAEANRSDMEYNIALAAPSSQNVINAKNDLQTVVSQYYPMMESRELDSLVTGLVLSHHLNPLTMTISDPIPQRVTGYVASSRSGQSAATTVSATPAPTDTATDIGSASATEDAAAAAAAAGDTDTPGADTAAATVAANTDFIYTATISGTATGTREDCVALLDDIAANYPSVQLTIFSIKESAAATKAAEGEDAPAAISTFAYTMVIYMCDKEAIQ